MINLDIDLSYLSEHYNIASSNLEMYKNKSITKIMEIEAKQGNKLATEALTEITNSPEEVARLFRLVNPKNRYLILIHMNESDLTDVMALLEPEELILGLSIFTPEALVKLMQKMEPESLSKLVLENMEIEKFLKSIPEEFMNEFLMSDKLDKEIFMKSLVKTDEEHLQKMMENLTGTPCYEDKNTILTKVGTLENDKFLKAMLSFEPEGKQQLIANIIKDDEDLFTEFSAEAMTYPFKTMEKEDILKSLTVLETEEMLPMVEDLPQELMALIATQINPKVFSELLCKEFKDVIAECGIAG